jgi:predicted alternative tryptophan synthase beta-subunit
MDPTMQVIMSNIINIMQHQLNGDGNHPSSLGIAVAEDVRE